jgi:L-ascorbate metabolism protein UlaG (beta-lactamase superfamily)
MAGIRLNDPTILPEHGSGVSANELTFIGTATVLLRIGGFTVLTDPNFLHQGQHAKLGYGLRSKRLTEPAMALADLPPLDLVLLSHHHGDHFDEVAADGLAKDLPIVTTAHAARKLRRQGFRRPLPLDTWETQVFERGRNRLSITAMPGRHAPGPLAKVLPPVMGSMLTVEQPGFAPFRIYVTGDTLLIDELAEIPRRYPDIDLGLFHLGGTRVLGVLVTMDAAQGIDAVRLVAPRAAIPIHYDDYTVFKSPLRHFTEAVEVANLSTEVVYLDRGDRYPLAAVAGRDEPQGSRAGRGTEGGAPGEVSPP